MRFYPTKYWGTERGMWARMACKPFGINMYGCLGATKQALLRTLLNPSFNQSTQNPSLRWKSRRVRRAMHDRGDCYDGKPLRRPGTCWDLIVPISDIRLAVAQQRASAGDALRVGG